MTVSEAARPNYLRPVLVTTVLVVIIGLLFGVPWWTLVAAADWPTPVSTAGSVLFAVAGLGLPVLMFLGHGRGRDGASRAGDALLGIAWVLFAWSLIGNVLR